MNLTPLQKFTIELHELAERLSNLSEFQRSVSHDETISTFHRIKGAAGFLEMKSIEECSRRILTHLRCATENSSNHQTEGRTDFTNLINSLRQEISHLKVSDL